MKTLLFLSLLLPLAAAAQNKKIVQKLDYSAALSVTSLVEAMVETKALTLDVTLFAETKRRNTTLYVSTSHVATATKKGYVVALSISSTKK